jgi:hypothetical protein
LVKPKERRSSEVQGVQEFRILVRHCPSVNVDGKPKVTGEKLQVNGFGPDSGLARPFVLLNS